MEYLFTERAHLMCPNMCFGIALSVKKEFDPVRIKETAEVLAQAHPFLRALIGYESEKNAYYYDITGSSQTQVLIREEETAGPDAPEVMTEFHLAAERDIDLFKEGLLKVRVWKAGKDTVFLLIFHHLLADGRGALFLAEELAAYYMSGIKPNYAEEKLISSIADFPQGSRLPFLSRLLVNRANREWKKENHSLTYEEYHEFADSFLQTDPVKHELSVIGKEELSEIQAECRSHHVTVNDYLLAKCFLEENTKKIIMACDLRDRLSFFHQGALGNYSTAFSIEIRKKEEHLFSMAEKVHTAVQKKMNNLSDLYLVLQCYAELEPGLLDAAFLSCRGAFNSKAGKFIGSMFFGFGAATGYSITNLGKLESCAMEQAFFIPPASPAMKKTFGVLTLNGSMRICTSER